jgi:hypothetical protein
MFGCVYPITRQHIPEDGSMTYMDGPKSNENDFFA